VLADDPALTARGAYRERPLLRVVFDRRLRTPPTARVLSTPEAGPVIIVGGADRGIPDDRRRALEARRPEVVAAGDGTVRAAISLLGERRVGSVLLEGGAAMHAAAWDEDLVDFVRLYVAPVTLGGGVAFLDGRGFSSTALHARRVEEIGPDVVIEGYVHGPH
jgi:diaminohydroxyphosphoribosylaminopyrimidine deaminase/5-amino-6-(5-phosphoribosylamino)uracil reductase